MKLEYGSPLQRTFDAVTAAIAEVNRHHARIDAADVRLYAVAALTRIPSMVPF